MDEKYEAAITEKHQAIQAAHAATEKPAAYHDPIRTPQARRPYVSSSRP